MPGSGPVTMRMFPLGTVLVPSMVLPLNVFEDRYRQMISECLDGAPEIGVVLIERGSEVGGGDVRTDVGTVARIVSAQGSRDEGYRLVAVGDRRIRVTRWLPDAPYPRAQVVDWPEEPAPAASDPDAARDAAVASLRRALELQARLAPGGPPPDVDVSPDATMASHQVGVLGPLGPLDRQSLLVAAGPAERLALAVTLLDEASELLEARLGER